MKNEFGYQIPENYKPSPYGHLFPYGEDDIQAVVDCMRANATLSNGVHMAEFEKKFAAYIGVEHAFAMDNATNCLQMAAYLIGFEPGDEVIVPGYTFVSSASTMAKAGAKIVWGDMDPDNWNLSPADLERKITPNTKAVVVVHLLGMPAKMDELMPIIRKHNLILIEDCAQAIGASINGRKVGSYGDFACFSFHTAKNITTLGEGGMLVVRDKKYADMVAGMRFVGTHPYEETPERKARYWYPAMSCVDFDREGLWPCNYSMPEPACACGVSQLNKVEAISESLLAQGMKIRKAFEDTPEITFCSIPEGVRHVHHQFVLHFEGANGYDRNDLLDITTKKYGIRNIVQYYPLYRYPLFVRGGFGDHDCPVLDAWWDNSFSFPWWGNMSESDMNYFITCTKAAIAELKARAPKA